jgi:hypothetical protein
MLSKSASEDEALNRCSLEAHLLYVQTLPHLDRDGLITGRPLLLWRLALPLRVDFIDITGRLIDEWVQHGLVVRYAGKDGPVLFFKGFRRHNQNIPYAHEAPSVYPPPPGWIRVAGGLIPEDEQERLALADRFDVRSGYRKLLLNPAASDLASRSRPPREPLARRTRPHRDGVAHQDQREDQSGGGGDPSLTSVCGMGGEGVGAGGGGQHLLTFPLDVLRRAAVELGPLLFGSDFRGYGAYVAGADAQTLTGLLEWIGYFWERIERTEGIRELPAYVRSCLNRGDRPQLTTRERQTLLELIEQVQERSSACD